MNTERDEQSHQFVVARRAGLVRTATLLTAGDAHLAEDLVQSTLTKLYMARPAFQRADNPMIVCYQPRARHSARCGRSAPRVESLPCPG